MKKIGFRYNKDLIYPKVDGLEAVSKVGKTRDYYQPDVSVKFSDLLGDLYPLNVRQLDVRDHHLILRLPRLFKGLTTS